MVVGHLKLDLLRKLSEGGVVRVSDFLKIFLLRSNVISVRHFVVTDTTTSWELARRIDEFLKPLEYMDEVVMWRPQRGPPTGFQRSFLKMDLMCLPEHFECVQQGRPCVKLCACNYLALFFDGLFLSIYKSKTLIEAKRQIKGNINATKTAVDRAWQDVYSTKPPRLKRNVLQKEGEAVLQVWKRLRGKFGDASTSMEKRTAINANLAIAIIESRRAETSVMNSVGCLLAEPK